MAVQSTDQSCKCKQDVCRPTEWAGALSASPLGPAIVGLYTRTWRVRRREVSWHVSKQMNSLNMHAASMVRSARYTVLKSNTPNQEDMMHMTPSRHVAVEILDHLLGALSQHSETTGDAACWQSDADGGGEATSALTRNWRYIGVKWTECL